VGSGELRLRDEAQDPSAIQKGKRGGRESFDGRRRRVGKRLFTVE
jgi:hypothetical protein